MNVRSTSFLLVNDNHYNPLSIDTLAMLIKEEED